MKRNSGSRVYTCLQMLSAFSLIFLINTTGLKAGDIHGTVKAIGVRNAENAVIYIEKVDGQTFRPPEKHALMDQKDLTFIPHVLPVIAGTVVDFLNDDKVMHNVFCPDKCADKFNLGSWPQGQIRSYTFQNPGCRATLLCNVHPEMEGYVVVLQNPYFAVSNKDGSYSIKNVPPGKYSLTIWHEKLKGKPVEITVPQTGEVTQDFVIEN
jgi:plastocyanin